MIGDRKLANTSLCKAELSQLCLAVDSLKVIGHLTPVNTFMSNTQLFPNQVFAEFFAFIHGKVSVLMVGGEGRFTQYITFFRHGGSQ